MTMSSVKASERKPNKLEVFLQARKLCIYTLQITANEKIFFPQFYRAMTRRLEDLAVNIHAQCWKANNILLNAEGLPVRRALQESAISDCYVFLSLLDVAAGLFHLRAQRVKYWTELIVTVRLLQRMDTFYAGLWRQEDGRA